MTSILRSISLDLPHAADVLEERVLLAAERLESFPRSGRVVPEVGSEDYREVIIPPYRLIYRLLNADDVRILAFYHSARRLPELQ